MIKTLTSLLYLYLVTALNLTATAQEDNSLLWKISGQGIDKPSYLFGTIHLMCPQDIKITDAMQAAIANSEQMVMELDMDEPGMMQNMMASSTMQDGTTLKSLMSDEDYQLLEKFMMDSIGAPLQPMATMKPMLLSTIVMLPVLKCQPGSYELSLVSAAQDQDIEILGLETVADQVAIFDAIPLEEQSDYLVKSIREYEKTAEETRNMIRLYREENVSQLYQIIHENMAEMEGGEDALLTDRNQKWIPMMEEMAAKKATFFAVGAGHLGGPEGVITLLRKAGYQVEAVHETL